MMVTCRAAWSVLATLYGWLRGDDCSEVAVAVETTTCSLLGARSLLDGTFNDRWGSNSEIAEGTYSYVRERDLESSLFLVFVLFHLIEVYLLSYFHCTRTSF